MFGSLFNCFSVFLDLSTIEDFSMLPLKLTSRLPALCFHRVKARLAFRLSLRPSKLNNDSELGRRNRPWMLEQLLRCSCLHRKEVIQPHLPIRLPCYDFTPVANPTFGGAFLAVRLPTSGITGSHGVTGGVYKARERIHRGMMIRDY
jgi:hypothetical protein